MVPVFKERRSPAEWFYYEQDVKAKAFRLADRVSEPDKAEAELRRYCEHYNRIWREELLRIGLKAFSDFTKIRSVG